MSTEVGAFDGVTVVVGVDAGAAVAGAAVAADPAVGPGGGGPCGWPLGGGGHPGGGGAPGGGGHPGGSDCGGGGGVSAPGGAAAAVGAGALGGATDAGSVAAGVGAAVAAAAGAGGAVVDAGGGAVVPPQAVATSVTTSAITPLPPARLPISQVTAQKVDGRAVPQQGRHPRPRRSTRDPHGKCSSHIAGGAHMSATRPDGQNGTGGLVFVGILLVLLVFGVLFSIAGPGVPTAPAESPGATEPFVPRPTGGGYP
jgi:hypothetical protein